MKVSFKRNVPSISALVTFEAASRLRSFTAAARELGVSQAAVSRQVRLLETDFGVQLFHRAHRAVEPTQAGARLGRTLSTAFDTISQDIDAIRSPRDGNTLSVGGSLAFTQFWLMSRLPEFRERYPGIRIRVVSQDEPFDLRTDEVDVMVRFGVPPLTGGRSVSSVGDMVFPVCAPGFNRAEETRGLHDLPLIGSDAPDPTWMQWGQWFRHVGLDGPPPGVALHCNHYTDAILAAMAGQGVALGWELLVADLLRSGKLVRLGELAVSSPAHYTIMLPEHRDSHPVVHDFAHWLAGRLDAVPLP